jgi:hypothetical protein
MIALAIVLRDPLPSTNAIARVPSWAWSGAYSARFSSVRPGSETRRGDRQGGTPYR